MEDRPPLPTKRRCSPAVLGRYSSALTLRGILGAKTDRSTTNEVLRRPYVWRLSRRRRRERDRGASLGRPCPARGRLGIGLDVGVGTRARHVGMGPQESAPEGDLLESWALGILFHRRRTGRRCAVSNARRQVAPDRCGRPQQPTDDQEGCGELPSMEVLHRAPKEQDRASQPVVQPPRLRPLRRHARPAVGQAVRRPHLSRQRRQLLSHGNGTIRVRTSAREAAPKKRSLPSPTVDGTSRDRTNSSPSFWTTSTRSPIRPGRSRRASPTSPIWWQTTAPERRGSRAKTASCPDTDPGRTT